MPKSQYNKIMNNSQDNISSPEAKQPTLSPEYSKTSEAEENNIENKLMNVIKVSEEEISKSLKGLRKRHSIK